MAFTADISALPPVAQPFLTLVNGMPVRSEVRDERVGQAGAVAAAERHLYVGPAEPGVTQRRVDRVERELTSAAAGLPAELRQARADDRHPCAHCWFSRLLSVANRGTGSVATSVT